MNKVTIITLGALMALMTTQAMADVHVRSYTKQDGTFVQGYTRGEPDGLRWNNRD